MKKKHTHAKPTNKEVLKSNPLVSTSKAQELYSEGKIGKREFECATKDCHAPLTCKFIDKPNATAFFIEGKRTENLHISNCDFSNREIKNVSKGTASDPHFSVDFSETYIGNSPRDKFVNGLGTNFLSTNEAESEKAITDESEENNLNSSSSKKKKNDNPVKKKIYRKRISNMETAVSLYENDPNHIIEDWFLGRHIPIKRYFTYITLNKFQTRLKDTVPIYYGKGFINDTPTSDYRFNFASKKKIDNLQYRPHFYISKDFIDTYFPFLTERVQNNPKKPFMIYIRARFALYPKISDVDSSRLMFQYLGSDLLNLVYFSDI